MSPSSWMQSITAYLPAPLLWSSFCPPFASVNVSICFAYWDWLALIQYVCGWWQQWKNILSFQLGTMFCHCLFKIWPLQICLLPKLTAVHLTNITERSELCWKCTSNWYRPAEADEMCQHGRNSLLMWSALSTFLWKGLRMENLLVWIIWWVLLGTINSAFKSASTCHLALHHPGALKYCHLEDIWSVCGEWIKRKFWAIFCES